MADVRIRPMREDDVEVAERLSAESYHEVEMRLGPRAWPDPAPRPASRGVAWCARTRHLIATDPGGCWVAEVEGEVAGFAVSFTRELMWILASFAVRTGLQGQGLGRELLGAALHHGRGCLRGMLTSSADPRAARRYRQAGFGLHPQMLMTGVVDRSALPVVEGLREGTPADRDLCDSVDRQTRGAAHGPDHAVLAATHRLVVRDRATGSGYAYLDADGVPALLAATTRRVAADLLWEGLAASPADRPITLGHLTAANEWALDVGHAARLSLHQSGYLALRGLKPPSPYVHHGSLL